MQRFDIELRKNDKLVIAFECKKPRDKISSDYLEKSSLKKDYTNENGHFVAQLRSYCYNSLSDFNPNTIPVLTDGIQWFIFDTSSMRRTPLKKLDPKDVIFDKELVQ